MLLQMTRFLSLRLNNVPLCVPTCAQSLGRVQLFATPWTIAHQVPLTMGFSRQEYWSWLPFPTSAYVYIHREMQITTHMPHFLYFLHPLRFSHTMSIWTMILWMWENKYHFKLIILLPKEIRICSEVGLLDQMVVQFLISALFSIVPVQVYIPTVYRNYLFSTYLPAFVISSFFIIDF